MSEFANDGQHVQKPAGEVKASLEALTKTVNVLVVKVDDLTAWKNKMLGGAVVACVVAAVALVLAAGSWMF